MGPRPTVAKRAAECYFFGVFSKRKEGHVQNFYFRYYRQRGPVNALQMRLQG